MQCSDHRGWKPPRRKSGLEERPCGFNSVYCVYIMQTQFISAVTRIGKVVTVVMIMFVADVHEVCI